MFSWGWAIDTSFSEIKGSIHHTSDGRTLTPSSLALVSPPRILLAFSVCHFQVYAGMGKKPINKLSSYFKIILITRRGYRSIQTRTIKYITDNN
jgi:hypothetical protein